ncbi:metalloproteinase inhibitor 3-like [Leptopilina boulardi]|uniref:metalloproteinase inhibitor 3-like n=1 Tax=Leptopilina boulardi TaxID=63433 RepID=UPI0021F5B101|nr:metalloproteinase inhibitor 3-like [Leptopilina boulardi]
MTNPCKKFNVRNHQQLSVFKSKVSFLFALKLIFDSFLKMHWQFFCIQIFLIALFLLSVQKIEAICNCLITHPQYDYCRSDFVVVIKVNEVIEEDYENYLIYKVNVKKVFKYLKNWKNLLGNKIYTPASIMNCGVRFELNKKYFVSGHFENGKPIVTICDAVIQSKKITNDQYSGFDKRYKENCECSILYTPLDQMESVYQELNKTTCIWESNPKSFDCQLRHGICRMDDNNQCLWDEKQSYRNCMNN